MIQTFSILLLCSILMDTNGLNCRTEGSLKSDELKKIFNNCLRHNEGTNGNKNSSDDYADSSDRSDNDRKRKSNGEEVNHWMDERSDRARYEGRGRQHYDDSDGSNQYSGRSYQNGRNNRDRMDNGHKMNGESRSNNNYQTDNYNRQDNQDSKYGSESQRNMYAIPTHRYKRERSEKNSGQRSQYNPNPSRNDESYRDKNSNSSRDEKACAMHCFLDNFHMTGENGMPDRYLVTNAMTKNVRNEDLRDFLQESIEECFQILDNENTEDKCEFSKKLLICLSEKGRANCDDWKDDIQFT